MVEQVFLPKTGVNLVDFFYLCLHTIGGFRMFFDQFQKSRNTEKGKTSNELVVVFTEEEEGLD